MRTCFRAAGAAGLLGSMAMLAGCSDLVTGLETSSLKPLGGYVGQQFVPGVPKGFQCPLVAGGFDPAGSIYRVDKDGTYFRVKDYSTDSAVAIIPNHKREMPISNAVLSDTQQANAGMSMDLLRKVAPGLAPSGDADYKTAITVDVTVEDMVGESIDDRAAEKIIELFKANTTPEAGNTYFLVREAVRAGVVSYKLREADLAKLGGKDGLQKLVQGQANVTVRSGGDGVVEVRRTFKPDRMPICIKSAEVMVGAGAAPIVVLKTAEETAPPKIKRAGGT